MLMLLVAWLLTRKNHMSETPWKHRCSRLVNQYINHSWGGISAEENPKAKEGKEREREN